MYRRSRLLPALSTWHFVAQKETHSINSRAHAARKIQSTIRIFLTRRRADHRRRARGSTTSEGALFTHGIFRPQEAQNLAAEYETCEKKDEKRRQAQQDAEVTKEEVKRASTVIQAAWRATVGREEGADRARRKLKEVLNELGGGRGRMHRWGERGIRQCFLVCVHGQGRAFIIFIASLQYFVGTFIVKRRYVRTRSYDLFSSVSLTFFELCACRGFFQDVFFCCFACSIHSYRSC